MNFFSLVLANLARDKIRTQLSAIAVASTFILYGLLATLLAAFSAGLQDASADRLVTMHKISNIQSLPLPYLQRIALLPQIDAVTHFTWFGGYYQSEKQLVTVLPTDPNRLFLVMDHIQLNNDAKTRWLANRQGAIVGAQLAAKYQWKVGDRVSIGSQIYPQTNGSKNWSVIIDGIFTAADNHSAEQNLYLHYEYFNLSRLFGQHSVSWFASKLKPGSNIDQVSQSIDQLFENAPQASKTQTEKALVREFVAQIGNVGQMVNFVMLIAVLSMLVVISSNLLQSFAQRLPDLAVLRVLGFAPKSLLTLVALESLLLVVGSALIGLALAFGLILLAEPAILAAMPSMQLDFTPFLSGIGWALLLGLLMSLIPVIKLQRANLVQVLHAA